MVNTSTSTSTSAQALNVTLNDISDELYKDEEYNMAIYNYLLHATNDEDEIKTINDEIDAYQEALCFGEGQEDEALPDGTSDDDDDDDDEPTLNVTLNDISNASWDEAYNFAIYDFLLYATDDPDERQTIKDALYEYTEILGEINDMMYEPPEDQNAIFMNGMTYAEYIAEIELLVNQIPQQNIPVHPVQGFAGQSMCLSY